MVLIRYISGHNRKDNVRNINTRKVLDIYYTNEIIQSHKILGMTISHGLLRCNAVCYLFLYGVFNDNVFISDNTIILCQMIRLLMHNELVRMWEETVMILHNTPALAWTDREETRSVRQHSQYPAECRTGHLPTCVTCATN